MVGVWTARITSSCTCILQKPSSIIPNARWCWASRSSSVEGLWCWFEWHGEGPQLLQKKRPTTISLCSYMLSVGRMTGLVLESSILSPAEFFFQDVWRLNFEAQQKAVVLMATSLDLSESSQVVTVPFQDLEGSAPFNCKVQVHPVRNQRTLTHVTALK